MQTIQITKQFRIKVLVCSSMPYPFQNRILEKVYHNMSLKNVFDYLDVWILCSHSHSDS